MWPTAWQWKIQLPGRSGDQASAIMAPGGRASVTARRRSVRGIGGVPRAVAHAVDAEIEAVQVHRVVETSEVDQPPAERVALRNLQPLGVRPGPAVDRERGATDSAGAGRVEREPPGDEEDAIGGTGRSRRVHHDRAVELAVLGATAEHRGRCRGAGIVVRAGCGRLEVHFAHLAGREPEAVGRDPALVAEPVDGERLRERVAEGGTNGGPGRDPDERAWVLKRLPFLGEGGHGKAESVAAVRIPDAVPGLEADGEHAVREPAGRMPVVVDGHLGRRSGGRRPRRVGYRWRHVVLRPTGSREQQGRNRPANQDAGHTSSVGAGPWSITREAGNSRMGEGRGIGRAAGLEGPIGGREGLTRARGLP